MHRIFRWLFTKSENPEIVPPEQSAASSRSVSHRSVSHQSVSHQSASHQSASHRSVSNKSASVPSIFLPHLKKLEPNARFEFLPPDLIKSSNRGKIYYAKMGIIPRRREVHRAEAKLVKILDESAPKLALTVLASGFFTCNDGGSGSKTYRTYFLYEGRQLMSLSLASARILGERLAKEVHSRKYPHGFGIYSSRNHRSDKSDHDCYPSWDKCFDALIGGALSRLDCEVYPALCDKGQKVKKHVVPVLLSPQRLVIKPVLIHGNLWEDIWGGTIGEDKDGKPVISNPAPMFAHNEFDLAVGRAFGGLPDSFYEEYHKHFPQSNPARDYNLRSDLYQLFYHLNHIAAFGGRHANVAETKMDRLLESFPQKHVRFGPQCKPRSSSTSRR